MTAMYWCNEDDRVYTVEELRKNFEQFKAEGEYAGVPFGDYLTGCMWWNNGALTPLVDHVTALRRRLNAIKPEDMEYFDDEIANLTAQITECETLMKGSV